MGGPLAVSALPGATRHWKRAEASQKVLDSLEVETTAYVLLAVLSGPPLPGFDLTYASGVARWLLQQQNPYGGFASTQVGGPPPTRTRTLNLHPKHPHPHAHSPSTSTQNTHTHTHTHTQPPPKTPTQIGRAHV